MSNPARPGERNIHAVPGDATGRRSRVFQPGSRNGARYDLNRGAWQRFVDLRELCPSCGSEMKVVAFIIDHAVVDKILTNLKRRAEYKRERGPPGRSKLAAVL